MSVVTLTPAGAIDATYRVGQLARGAFMRADSYEREMSGKGVNVSAALAAGGVASLAIVVMGEDDLSFALRSEHAALLRPVLVPGATRVNTSIIDAEGFTTKVNAAAPAFDDETWRSVVLATIDAIRDASWLVISGSIPAVQSQPGPADISDLVAEARRRGVQVALDSSGVALSRAAAEPGGLSLVKPNTDELAELVGQPLRTLGDVRSAALSLVDRGIACVYASLGADGVLVVTASHTVHAFARAPRLANTAGAGDASLAGFLVGLGAGSLADVEALARAASGAAAFGALAVSQETTILPSLEGLPDAVVTMDPDLATVLSEPSAAG